MGSVLSNWHYDMNHSISRSIKYRNGFKYWNCLKINVEMISGLLHIQGLGRAESI